MVGELSFFELGVEHVERGRAFYEGLFGWRFERGPSGEGLPSPHRTFPPGMHGVGSGAAPYVFFRVEDIEAAVERVRELGGVVDETDVESGEESIAKFCRFKLCRDDQGSPFGLHQPATAS